MAGLWHCLILGLLMCVCLSLYTEAQFVGGAVSKKKIVRRKKKTQAEATVAPTPPSQIIEMEKMWGKWYLYNVASKCPFLMEHGTKAEPTVMTLTAPSQPGGPIAVSTKTRHDHQCWEILQVYHPTPEAPPGRLTLKGVRPELNTDIVIVDTDYRSYAVMVYKKRGKITVKLYGRTLDDIPEELLIKFEGLAEKQGLSLAYLYSFPTYSHCGTVHKDQVMNCILPPC